MAGTRPQEFGHIRAVFIHVVLRATDQTTFRRCSADLVGRRARHAGVGLFLPLARPKARQHCHPWRHPVYWFIPMGASCRRDYWDAAEELLPKLLALCWVG